MFIEKLTEDDVAEYVHDVTLRNEKFDSMKVCSISNWYTRLGECECRQVDFVIERAGEVVECSSDILDFSFLREHCVFMLKHFGDEYLNYLRVRVAEEDISDSTKTYFIKQNENRLAFIKAHNAAKQTVLIGQQKTLLDYDSQMGKE